MVNMAIFKVIVMGILIIIMELEITVVGFMFQVAVVVKIIWKHITIKLLKICTPELYAALLRVKNEKKL